MGKFTRQFLNANFVFPKEILDLLETTEYRDYRLRDLCIYVSKFDGELIWFSAGSKIGCDRNEQMHQVSGL